MRAKFIFEKFTDESDPIKDLGIGATPKVILTILKQKMAKYNIRITWEDSGDWGSGTYEIYAKDLDPHNYYDDYMPIQLYYATNEAAQAEGFDAGFELNNEWGDSLLKKPTHYYEPIVKALIKIKFGTKFQMAQKIKKLEKQLIILKNAEQEQ